MVCRQRPGTASGVIFMTTEDESAIANIIVWPKVFERHRKTVLRSRLLGVRGIVQREGRVIHVIARHLEDLSGLLNDLDAIDEAPGEGPMLLPAHAAPQADTASFPSRDFH